MSLVNDSKKQSFTKASVAFAEDAERNSPGAEKVHMLGTTSWILCQIREQADKKQILQGGIVLFSCQSAPLHNLLRCENFPLEEVPLQSYIDLNVFIPLMGHNWLSYTEVRGSCHVLEVS